MSRFSLSLSLYIFWLLGAVLGGQFQFDLDTLPVVENATLHQTYQSLSDDSLLWGPYRSGHYLGIRPRIPQSLISGLFWFNADSQRGVASLRHSYEQGHDLAKANWVNFNPRIGGRQFISDNECHVNITIDFVKSANGQNWAVKVKSTPHKGYENVVTSFVWYSGLEGEERSENEAGEVSGFLKLDNEYNANGYKTVKLSGISKELGIFDIQLNDGGRKTKNKHPKGGPIKIPDLDPSLAHHLSLRVPDGNVWKASEIFVTLLQDSIKDLVERLGNKSGQVPSHQGLLVKDLTNYEGNMHFIQRTYQGACEFDVVYNAASEVSDRISFENMKTRIKDMHGKLNANFERHFPLEKFSKQDKSFAKELLSGLLGGLSYFHGDHMVDRTTSLDDEDLPENINGEVHLPKFEGVREGPFELFTLVPSRPFFPRGFYWDEGFHLLPILDYDSDLALEIVKSWFDLVDDDGWIAREQILGAEARARVPADFIVQSNAVVNPPTIMLAFTQLLERASELKMQQNIDVVGVSHGKNMLGHTLVTNPELLSGFTKEIYPKLKLHFEGFRKSQQGEVDEFDRGSNRELYRWRGRTSTHSLASGLDDYPRAMPLDIAELNVDLLCWVGVMTRSIKKVAEGLNIQDDVDYYTQIETDITENIEKFHWSEEDHAYCDASLDDDDNHVLACYKGYISLFPFLTKFVPAQSTDKLRHIVDLLADPAELWTEYGIRSLSASDEFYRTAENYWRSPIWININYLVLDSLAHYHEASRSYLTNELREKIEDVYTKLRLNLINNVKSEWERTGFVWEQYDDITGTAKGAKNFMGWSSLVLLMMAMPETLELSV